jgi:hypothetical protein
MSRTKKGAVKNPALCCICSEPTGKGGALMNHVQAKHKVPYDMYKRCFQWESGGKQKQKWIFDEITETSVHVRLFPKRIK